MAAWQHFLERLPGVVGLKTGHAFVLGSTTSLPTCEARRRGEQRQVDGGTGVADRIAVCLKDAADAYGWSDVTLAATPMIVFLMRGAMNDTPTDFDWVNQPAAATEMRSTMKRKIDLSTARQVRLWVNVATAGTSGADLYLRYSTDDSSYTDITGATVTVDATGWRDSGWQNLPSAARAVVWIQPWGKDGNGVADPRFTAVYAQIR